MYCYGYSCRLRTTKVIVVATKYKGRIRFIRLAGMAKGVD